MDIGDWLEELLPREYLSYRGILQRSLLYFLEQLSPRRRQQILAHQWGQATSQERLVQLMRDCPTLHKLGQMLARDPRLAVDFRRQLQSLESSFPLSQASQFSWPDGLEPQQALAEGSVGCVFACRWGNSEVVAKRLKPGVEEQLREEFQIWQGLAQELPGWRDEFHIPDFDYESTVLSLVRLLEDELHPEREQQQLLRAAHRFEDWNQVQIPRVYPQLALPDGLVMERLYGQPLLTHPQAQEYFSLAIQVLLSDPFFADEDEGVFHLDPHPGNLWITQDGRLALLDWGSTLYFSKHQRVLLTQALLAAWRGDQQDWQLFGSQFTGWSVGPCPPRGRLSQLFQPSSWGSRLPVELILLRKVLFHLEGVEAELGQDDLLWHLLVQAGGRFLAELPMRLFAPADWRGFSTHLSNLDLLRHAVLTWLGPPTPSHPPHLKPE